MKKALLLIPVIVLILIIGPFSRFQDHPDKSNGIKNKTKLSLWCYYEGKVRFEKIMAICNEFNASNDEIEVTPEYIPFADFNKQLFLGYSSGRAPDLAIVDNPVNATFAAQGILVDLTDKVKSQIKLDSYLPASLKTCVYNGRIYGLPLGNNCLALFYNKKMLRTAGLEPPKNWSELASAARKLTQIGRYGLGISATMDEQGAFQLLHWLLSTGASPERLNSVEGIKTFDFLSSLIDQGSMSTEVMNWTPSDELEQFISGKIAMMINGSWQIPELKDQAPDLSYGVVEIPMDKKNVSILGGENVVVVNGANANAAIQVLSFIQRNDVLRKFSMAFGYIPPRKDIASEKYWTADPVWSVFKRDVEGAIARGPDIKWPEISQAMITALQEVLSQAKTSEEAVTEAQSSIDAITSSE